MNRIIQGDVIEGLRSLPDGIVHTCVTSPPYWGLRDYGVPGQIGLEKTPEEYVEKMVEVFREVRRVLRDDGTLWLNLGDSYARNGGKNGQYNAGKTAKVGSTKRRVQLGNYRVPDGLKEKDLVGIPWRVAFALQGMAVIPATSIAQWSDWLREARETGDWEMVRMVEERLRRYAWIEALQADGWYLRSDIIWHKPNAMPESVKDRPTKAHEYIFLLSKSPKYYYDADAIREPLAEATIERSKYPRFQNPKNRKDVNYGNPKTEESAIKRMLQRGKRNKRTVWTVSTKPFKEAHFAVFPPDLIEPCILAGSPEKACPHCGAPWVRMTERGEHIKMTGGRIKIHKAQGPHGKTSVFNTGCIIERITVGWKPTCQCEGNDGSGRGIVLDPFFGSGTTGLVAQKHGRQWIGVELNPDYIEIAKRRLAEAK